VTKQDHWGFKCADYELKKDDCQLHKGELRMRSDEYMVVAKYQGNVLTVGEFYMLTDAKYVEGVEHIRSKSGMCKLSLVPSTIAIIGAAVAIAAVALNNGGEGALGTDAAQTLVVGGGLAFGGGAILSYPLGGYACWSAHGEADDLALSIAHHHAWYLDKESDAEHLKKLADDFNAKQAGHAPEREETPEITPPAKPEPKPTKPEPTNVDANKDIVGTIEASGCCTIFLRAVAAADMTSALKGAGPLVVFAYSDKIFTNVDPKRIEKALNEHSTLRKELQNHISTDPFSPKSLAGGQQRLTMLSGKTLKLHGSPDEVKVGRASVDGQLQASNGSIYIVDTVLQP
jgi:uncharacterized surface protein with fasciclin (FAS1) repeats